MQPKAKQFPFRTSSPVLAGLTRSCVFILLVNWIAQGMRGMDGKELSFRLLLLVVSSSTIGLTLVGSGVDAAPAGALAGLIGHTLNFTLNGQFWVCARYCTCVENDATALECHKRCLIEQLRNVAWLDEAALIGSQALPERRFGPRSDLDLRLVFPAGSAAYWRTNWLLLRLRAAAFVARFPLDLYAYDEPSSLLRFDQREPLRLVLDRKGRLKGLFAASSRMVLR